jgi:hypothetical protein
MLPTTFAACRLRGAARFDRDLTSGRAGTRSLRFLPLALPPATVSIPSVSSPPFFLFLQWREANHEMRREEDGGAGVWAR